MTSAAPASPLETGDTSPDSKADDVLAMLHTIKTDPALDAHRIGVWGFSNGGWVAPIVATRFPLAFMILKSAPSESIAENVLYELGQVLREHGRFTQEQTSRALAFERTMFLALQTDSNWSAAGEALSVAEKQPWFPYMRIPPGMTTPPRQRCWLPCKLLSSTIRQQRCSAFVHPRSHCSGF
ncbi:MAG: hypothetical protein WB992_23305 [Bryobacteraceae bacterium]